MQRVLTEGAQYPKIGMSLNCRISAMVSEVQGSPSVHAPHNHFIYVHGTLAIGGDAESLVLWRLLRE